MRELSKLSKIKASTDASQKKTLGRGVFRRCDACGDIETKGIFEQNLEVCPRCSYHLHLSAEGWVKLLTDEGTWVACDMELRACDPLGFVDSIPYPTRIASSQEKAGSHDAILTGSAQLEDRAIQLGVFVFQFMGGSMGSVVGEAITRMMERGACRNEPVVLLSCSGGARMQEGTLSLMQMAKTVAARARLRERGVPFISVLLNPTTGGVAASFALLGDVNIAEPGALIGFAGARVIENTIGQQLPKGFQRSEFLLERGMIDLISPRKEMRRNVSQIVEYLSA